MNFVLPLIVPLLLVAAIAAAGIYLLKAWNNRTDSAYAPYNVGKHEARVAMQINIIRALAVVIVGVILLGILTISGVLQPGAAEEEEPTRVVEPSPTLDNILPTMTPELIVATDTPVPEVTINVPDTPTAVSVEEAPTATIEPLPTATDAPLTAVVSSGVGVWLRSSPSTAGEQLEWLLEGTELILLEDTAEGDSFNWQQVQAPSGEVGWVAVDFVVVLDS